MCNDSIRKSELPVLSQERSRKRKELQLLHLSLDDTAAMGQREASKNSLL